jgi:hypothetical protein
MIPTAIALKPTRDFESRQGGCQIVFKAVTSVTLFHDYPREKFAFNFTGWPRGRADAGSIASLTCSSFAHFAPWRR